MINLQSCSLYKYTHADAPTHLHCLARSGFMKTTGLEEKSVR